MSIRVRCLEVIKTCAVSPHLKRITLSGDDLADFPTDAESGYVIVSFLKQLILGLVNIERLTLRSGDLLHITNKIGKKTTKKN